MGSRLSLGVFAGVLFFGLYFGGKNIALAGEDGAKTDELASLRHEAEDKSKTTQVNVPKDKRIVAAMEVALPTITKVLGIHACVREIPALRQMNFYAVTGVDMALGYEAYHNHWAPMLMMEYHDKSKCLSVQAIDQLAMPALNALRFHVVYFADDSGEISRFSYLFKKVDDGSWKIASFTRER